MIIRVGPYQYTITLLENVRDQLGRVCAGLTDPVTQAIYVAAPLRPEKRLATAWHEIGHAWKAELDIHEADELAEEPLCNLIGMAMAHMPPKDLVRIHVYMTTGIDADDVEMLRGDHKPTPITSSAGSLAT